MYYKSTKEIAELAKALTSKMLRKKQEYYTLCQNNVEKQCIRTCKVPETVAAVRTVVDTYTSYMCKYMEASKLFAEITTCKVCDVQQNVNSIPYTIEMEIRCKLDVEPYLYVNSEQAEEINDRAEVTKHVKTLLTACAYSVPTAYYRGFCHYTDRIEFSQGVSWYVMKEVIHIQTPNDMLYFLGSV